MRKLLYLSLILLLSNMSVTFAQKVLVTGQITDKNTGENLPGVNVLIKGTTEGTITNLNGEFSLKADPSKDVLIVSFIGFKSELVELKGRTKIEIGMSEDQEVLDEVVVVGYGTVKKKDLTGSIATVNNESLAKTTNTSLIDGLQGRVAGASIISNEGTPGAGLQFQIRGATSINSAGQPLYVIDGFPIEAVNLGVQSNSDMSSSGNPIADLNPADIESVQILKDASATAIYGSRGANGVIMITTKKGDKGSMKVFYNASYGVQHLPQSKRFELMNAQEYSKFMYERSLIESDNVTGVFDRTLEGDSKYRDWETMENPEGSNWQDAVFKEGYVMTHNLNFNGGNEHTRYNIGLGYYEHDGLVDNNTFKRYSSNIKINTKLNEKFNINFVTNLSRTSNDGIATGGGGGSVKSSGIVMQTLRTKPTLPLDYGADDEDFEVDDADLDLTNPLVTINDVTKKVTTNRLLANGTANYSILDNLVLTSRWGVNLQTVNFESFYPVSTGRGRRAIGGNGTGTMGNNEFITLLNENILNYNVKFGGKSELKAMVGFTMEESNRSYFSAVNNDFSYGGMGTDNFGVGLQPGIPTSRRERNALMSGLARVNYIYGGKLHLTASLRADGSSRFGENNKWGYFPSGAVAYTLSEESFFKDNVSFMNQLKLRASYGKTGNQNIANYTSIHQLGIANYVLDGSTLTGGLRAVNLANPDLKWETTEQYNAGIDLSFFESRLMANVDLYYKYTTDMLLNVELPATTGYKRQMSNLGSMENKGIELSLTGYIIDKKDLSWSSTLTWTANRNKVLDLGSEAGFLAVSYGNVSGRIIEGQPIGLFWGFEQDGYYNNLEEVNNVPSGHIYKNLVTVGQMRFKDLVKSEEDPEGLINDEDRTIIGSYQPKFYGGLSNNFKYKGFTLDVLLNFRYGGSVYNGTVADLTNSNNYSLNRLKAVGGEESFQEAQYDDENNLLNADQDANYPFVAAKYTTNMVDTFVEDGSFVRLQSVSLGYTIPNRIVKKMNMSRLNVYVRGENLYVLTNYSGFDPEVNMGGATLPGVDWGAYPRPVSYTVGLKATF